MLIAFVFGEILAQLRQMYLDRVRVSVIVLFFIVISTVIIAAILCFKLEKENCIYVFLITISLCVGVVLTSKALSYSILLERKVGEKIYITGEIDSAEKNEFGNKYYLKNIAIKGQYTPGEVGKLNGHLLGNVNNINYGKILIIDKLESEIRDDFKLGRKINVLAQIDEIDTARNPGGFDSKKYYASIGVIGKVKLIKVEKIYKDYNGYRDRLFRLKIMLDKGLKNLKQCRIPIFNKLVDTYLEVIGGILLGNKLGNNEVRLIYQKAGIAHILAISGMHISFIGLGLYKLLRRIRGIKISVALSAIVVFSYVAMTGMAISAIRALIMYLIFLAAEVLGMTEDKATNISLAAFIILVLNPIAITNTGFQLSFIAVITLYLIIPKINDIYQSIWKDREGRVKDKQANNKENKKSRKFLIKMIWSLIASSILIAMLNPLIAYNYYELPTYAVIINILAMPLMAIVMGVGIVGLVIIYIAIALKITALYYIAKIVLIPATMVLHLYYLLSQKSLSLPLGNVIVGKPPIVEILIIYLIITISIIISYKRYKKTMDRYNKKMNNTSSLGITIMEIRREKKKLKISLIRQLGLIYLAVIVAVSILYFNPYIINIDKTKILFMDVGQGDGCGIIENPKGVATVDIGSSSMDKVGSQVALPALKSLGVKEIKYCIMTHADLDHISGIKEIISQSKTGVKVKTLVLPDIYLKDKDYMDLINIAKDNNVKVSFITSEEIFKMGNITFKCIHPGKEKISDDRNDYSTVLDTRIKGKEGEVKMLLTGDISQEIEKKYINKKIYEGYDILKVAHHGSNYSTGDEFLKLVRPKIAIISCGEYNRYGHPGIDTLNRLKNARAIIKRTDKEGGLLLQLR